MKKLMLIAAMAASFVGPMFAACSTCAKHAENGAAVYEYRFSGKTTIGKTVNGVCVRTPATLCIKGWIAKCTNDCETSIGTATDTGICYYSFWQECPYKAPIAAQIVWDSEFPHVMGSKNSDSEGYMTFSGDIKNGDDVLQSFEAVCSALGKFNKKAGVYNSFSGTFTGLATASLCGCYSCGPSKSVVCTCSDLETMLEDQKTVFYGTWSMKYNAAASKAFYNNGKLPKTPSYAVITNDK